MSWISTAILSGIVFAAVNVIDSHLLSKRFPSLQVYLLPIGIIYLIYGLVLLPVFPLPRDIGTNILLVAIASSTIRSLAVTIVLYAFQKEEISRVIPVAYTYPIFVALMAMPLLGERLGYLEWLAIISVVAGAMAVSFRQSPSGSATWPGKMFLILLGASLLMAVGDITTKYVLGYLSFWNLLWLGCFSLGGIALLLSLRARVFKQLAGMKRRNSSLALMGFNELLSPVGVVLVYQAIAEGPVSLVSTITGGRPIFVLAYALILSRVMPGFLEWQPGKGRLTVRIIATALVVGGIAIIQLS
ncbi:MAG: DMT family transporter [Chloroflexi bacterium]|nr:DMT family transporter [Chloroflexota bacterium]